MADNYKDTAYRMYDSAQVLYKDEMWFNTCYLAGYVAECYCKEILLLAAYNGYAFQNADNVKKFSHKLDKLQDEVEIIAGMGGATSLYCHDIQSECPTIYANWNPLERYQSDSYIFNHKETADKMIEEMEMLMEYIIQMEIDGVLL